MGTRVCPCKSRFCRLLSLVGESLVGAHIQAHQFVGVALTAGQHPRSYLKGAGAHEVSAFLTTHGSAVVFPPTL